MFRNVNFEGQFFCNANINFLIFVVLFLRIIILSILLWFLWAHYSCQTCCTECCTRSMTSSDVQLACLCLMYHNCPQDISQSTIGAIQNERDLCGRYCIVWMFGGGKNTLTYFGKSLVVCEILPSKFYDVSWRK